MKSRLRGFSLGSVAMAYVLALVTGAGTAAGLLAWATAPEARADAAPPAPVTVLVPDAASPLGPPAPVDRMEVLRGEIRRGQTLHAALTRFSVDGSTVHLIATEMRPLFDFRYSKPGHVFRLTRRPDGTLVEFEYRTSATEGYRLIRMGDGLVAQPIQVHKVSRIERLAGVITNSVYNAIRNLGESAQLAYDFADIFAFDVDFTRQVRPGDEFRVLYERVYHQDDQGEEVYIGPGRILAAQYRGAGVHTAVHFELPDGRGGYYRPDGSAVERQFLRAPVKYTRISSRFSRSRLHPVLKVRRPHLGIDFAAPAGEPVWSVAEGTVIFRGRNGGFGNLVKVKHPNGYVSYYGHLSRFARDLRVGDRVGQKQVIGYVGSTGLSTGPHVDFRIREGKRYINPSTLRTPPGDPIPAEQFDAFREVVAAHMAELDPTPIASLGEAL